MNDTILYIPIQINGGSDVPDDLLERELFIKNGELYVGTGDKDNKSEMIIGKVVPGATIKDATLTGKLMVTEDLVVTELPKTAEKGRILFVDEGQNVT